jgi:hypothetical protein
MSRRLNSDINKIFHGLNNITIVPGKYLSKLKPALASNVIKLGGRQIGLSSLQSDFLRGGTGGQTPTGGSITAELAGRFLTPRTTLAFTFHQLEIDSNIEDLIVEVDVKTGQTLTDIATDAVDGFKNAANGAKPTKENIRFYTSNPINNLDQIKEGFSTFYGTGQNAGFSNEGPIITIKALDSLGEASNELDISVEWKPAPPSLIDVNPEGFAIGVPGLEHAGYTEGLGFNAQGKENQIESDQSYFPIDSYITGSSAEVSFNALQDLSPRILRLGSGLTGVASTNEAEVILFNFLQRQQSFGLIVTSRTPTNDFYKLVFYQVKGSGLQLSQKKQNTPVQLKLTATPPEGREDVCYLSIPRPSIFKTAA